MKYLSVCSGIEAAYAALHPIGWNPILLSEIEAFPREVLKHRLGAHDARLSCRKVLMWKMFTLCAFMAGIATGVSGLREYQGRGWREDGPPPPITKVQVQTYGFLDKEGVWRSYDNGEKITVKNWKP